MGNSNTHFGVYRIHRSINLEDPSKGNEVHVTSNGKAIKVECKELIRRRKSIFSDTSRLNKLPEPCTQNLKAYLSDQISSTINCRDSYYARSYMSKEGNSNKIPGRASIECVERMTNSNNPFSPRQTKYNESIPCYESSFAEYKSNDCGFPSIDTRLGNYNIPTEQRMTTSYKEAKYSSDRSANSVLSNPPVQTNYYGSPLTQYSTRDSGYPANSTRILNYNMTADMNRTGYPGMYTAAQRSSPELFGTSHRPPFYPFAYGAPAKNYNPSVETGILTENPIAYSQNYAHLTPEQTSLSDSSYLYSRISDHEPESISAAVPKNNNFLRETADASRFPIIDSENYAKSPALVQTGTYPQNTTHDKKDDYRARLTESPLIDRNISSSDDKLQLKSQEEYKKYGESTPEKENDSRATRTSYYTHETPPGNQDSPFTSYKTSDYQTTMGTPEKYAQNYSNSPYFTPEQTNLSGSPYPHSTDRISDNQSESSGATAPKSNNIPRENVNVSRFPITDSENYAKSPALIPVQTGTYPQNTTHDKKDDYRARLTESPLIDHNISSSDDKLQLKSQEEYKKYGESTPEKENDSRATRNSYYTHETPPGNQDSPFTPYKTSDYQTTMGMPEKYAKYPLANSAQNYSYSPSFTPEQTNLSGSPYPYSTDRTSDNQSESSGATVPKSNDIPRENADVSRFPVIDSGNYKKDPVLKTVQAGAPQPSKINDYGTPGTKSALMDIISSSEDNPASENYTKYPALTPAQTGANQPSTIQDKIYDYRAPSTESTHRGSDTTGLENIPVTSDEAYKKYLASSPENYAKYPALTPVQTGANQPPTTQDKIYDYRAPSTEPIRMGSDTTGLENIPVTPGEAYKNYLASSPTTTPNKIPPNSLDSSSPFTYKTSDSKSQPPVVGQNIGSGIMVDQIPGGSSEKIIKSPLTNSEQTKSLESPNQYSKIPAYSPRAMANPPTKYNIPTEETVSDQPGYQIENADFGQHNEAPLNATATNKESQNYSKYPAPTPIPTSAPQPPTKQDKMHDYQAPPADTPLNDRNISSSVVKPPVQLGGESKKFLTSPENKNYSKSANTPSNIDEYRTLPTDRADGLPNTPFKSEEFKKSPELPTEEANKSSQQASSPESTVTSHRTPDYTVQPPVDGQNVDSGRGVVGDQTAGLPLEKLTKSPLTKSALTKSSGIPTQSSKLIDNNPAVGSSSPVKYRETDTAIVDKPSRPQLENTDHEQQIGNPLNVNNDFENYSKYPALTPVQTGTSQPSSTQDKTYDFHGHSVDAPLIDSTVASGVDEFPVKSGEEFKKYRVSSLDETPSSSDSPSTSYKTPGYKPQTSVNGQQKDSGTAGVIVEQTRMGTPEKIIKSPMPNSAPNYANSPAPTPEQGSGSPYNQQVSNGSTLPKNSNIPREKVNTSEIPGINFENNSEFPPLKPLQAGASQPFSKQNKIYDNKNPGTESPLIDSTISSSVQKSPVKSVEELKKYQSSSPENYAQYPPLTAVQTGANQPSTPQDKNDGHRGSATVSSIIDGNISKSVAKPQVKSGEEFKEYLASNPDNQRYSQPNSTPFNKGGAILSGSPDSPITSSKTSDNNRQPPMDGKNIDTGTNKKQVPGGVVKNITKSPLANSTQALSSESPTQSSKIPDYMPPASANPLVKYNITTGEAVIVDQPGLQIGNADFGQQFQVSLNATTADTQTDGNLHGPSTGTSTDKRTVTFNEPGIIINDFPKSIPTRAPRLTPKRGLSRRPSLIEKNVGGNPSRLFKEKSSPSKKNLGGEITKFPQTPLKVNQKSQKVVGNSSRAPGGLENNARFKRSNIIPSVISKGKSQLTKAQQHRVAQYIPPALVDKLKGSPQKSNPGNVTTTHSSATNDNRNKKTDDRSETPKLKLKNLTSKLILRENTTSKAKVPNPIYIPPKGNPPHYAAGFASLKRPQSEEIATPSFLLSPQKQQARKIPYHDVDYNSAGPSRSASRRDVENTLVAHKSTPHHDVEYTPIAHRVTPSIHDHNKKGHPNHDIPFKPYEARPRSPLEGANELAFRDSENIENDSESSLVTHTEEDASSLDQNKSEPLKEDADAMTASEPNKAAALAGMNEELTLGEISSSATSKLEAEGETNLQTIDDENLNTATLKNTNTRAIGRSNHTPGTHNKANSQTISAAPHHCVAHKETKRQATITVPSHVIPPKETHRPTTAEETAGYCHRAQTKKCNVVPISVPSHIVRHTETPKEIKLSDLTDLLIPELPFSRLKSEFDEYLEQYERSIKAAKDLALGALNPRNNHTLLTENPNFYGVPFATTETPNRQVKSGQPGCFDSDFKIDIRSIQSDMSCISKTKRIGRAASSSCNFNIYRVESNISVTNFSAIDEAIETLKTRDNNNNSDCPSILSLDDKSMIGKYIVERSGSVEDASDTNKIFYVDDADSFSLLSEEVHELNKYIDTVLSRSKKYIDGGDTIQDGTNQSVTSSLSDSEIAISESDFCLSESQGTFSSDGENRMNDFEDNDDDEIQSTPVEPSDSDVSEINSVSVPLEEIPKKVSSSITNTALNFIVGVASEFFLPLTNHFFHLDGNYGSVIENSPSSNTIENSTAVSIVSKADVEMEAGRSVEPPSSNDAVSCKTLISKSLLKKSSVYIGEVVQKPSHNRTVRFDLPADETEVNKGDEEDHDSVNDSESATEMYIGDLKNHSVSPQTSHTEFVGLNSSNPFYQNW